jgi:hypothetical protein
MTHLPHQSGIFNMDRNPTRRSLPLIRLGRVPRESLDATEDLSKQA